MGFYKCSYKYKLAIFRTETFMQCSVQHFDMPDGAFIAKNLLPESTNSKHLFSMLCIFLDFAEMIF